MKDISAIQLSFNQYALVNSSKAMIRKYQENEYPQAFLDFYKHNYVTRYSSWFEGYFPTGPSTNNALEGWNLAIKKVYFGWVRKTLEEFLDKSALILSYEYTIKTPNFDFPIHIDNTSIPVDEANFVKIGDIDIATELFLFLGNNSMTSRTREEKNSIFKFYTEFSDLIGFRDCKKIIKEEVVVQIINPIEKWQNIT